MREYFSGGITMTVTDGCFRLSTDSMVLADFCRLPRGAACLPAKASLTLLEPDR